MSEQQAGRRLRPHQRQAVADTLSVLTRGRRTTIISACGTGKTWMAAAVAHRLAGATDRVVVLVPTLELLAQSMTSWRAYGHGAPVMAVCSDEELTRTRQGARATDTTTAPAELATFASRFGTFTAFATYASLPVLIAAHRDHELPGWDLAVVDEAHRTSGSIGKPWAAVHSDDALPAMRRLYLTATPRILDDDGRTVASMDDETLFGPVAYRLGMGRAIEEKILADYRVAVAAVTTTGIRELIASHAVLSATDNGAVPAEDLALAVALLRTARRMDLHRIVSYHSRVAKARGFVRAVHVAQQILPEDERPEHLWAHATWGKIPAVTRRDLLQQFATGDGTNLLANARLLGEGVDVPELDAVVFADPKNSAIDTVQAIGRALRTGSTADKVATIVIPVFCGPGQNPEAVLDGSAWAPLWKTLRALHAHDDRLAGRLSGGPGSGGQDGSAGAAGAPDLSWLHLDGVPMPEDFALAVELRVLERKTAEWRRGFAAARRFHAAHGHLLIPQSYVDDQDVAVGAWLSWNRFGYQAGTLSPARVAALEALGIVWKPRATAWDHGFAVAEAFRLEHGHLVPPRDVVYKDFKLGAWLDNQRHREGDLAAGRRALLDGLDPWWNPLWDVAWQRNYRRAAAFVAARGDSRISRTLRDADGFLIGEWWTAQRRDWAGLHERQQSMLLDVGFDPAALSPHEEAWQRGVAAAARFRDERGHLDVPQKYIDSEGFALGVWVNNQRRRLTDPQRRVELDALGMRWGPAPAGSTDVTFSAPDGN